MNVNWKHPFTCIVSAPTKSGKTEFVKKLVLNSKEMIEPSPQLVYWAYTEWQPAYDELKLCPNVRFVEGVPDLNELKANQSVPKLLVLDDLMTEMSTNKNLVELFTVGVITGTSALFI